jgi:Glycosyl transferases group 1
MTVEPKLLVVWGQYPRWMPPVKFSARQVTLAVRVKAELQDQGAHNFNYFEEFEADGWLDANVVDLAEYCDCNGFGRNFDFIIVFIDEDMGLFPSNLGAFRCPTILLVGDTHHFSRPISTLISYAKREKISMVAGQFTAHHLHWFIGAGIEACAWIPGLVTRVIPGNSRAKRHDKIVFIGHSWEYHYYRFSLLETMRLNGLPIEIRIGTREEAGEVYGRSLISFNCSLNSDVNIRNFEILSSGGFLLTDDLPEVSGFRQLFRPGQGCEVYSDADDLLSKIAFYRRNPSLADTIAKRGHELFQNVLRPDQALKKFKKAFFEGEIDETMLPPDSRCYAPSDPNWLRRLETYEDVQEIHRKQSAVKVLIRAGTNWLRVEDFVDLPRVRFYSTTPRQGHKVEIVSLVAAASGDWDYVAGY